jgi:hypothetical protein
LARERGVGARQERAEAFRHDVRGRDADHDADADGAGDARKSQGARLGAKRRTNALGDLARGVEPGVVIQVSTRMPDVSTVTKTISSQRVRGS